MVCRVLYVHPNNDTNSPAVEGLLYNWAAATVGEDGVHGKGGISGKEKSQMADSEKEKHLYPVQGVCPNGWHLPSVKDYDMLRDAMIANPAYYSTDATLTADNIGKAFKHPEENYIGEENKGTSKLASDGGFAALLVVGWGMNAVSQ